MSSLPQNPSVPQRPLGRTLPYKASAWLGEVYASDDATLPGELWKAAEGFADYEVSSRGRVRRRNTGALLRPLARGRMNDVNRAYLRVDLMRDDGKGGRERKTVAVHSLVARTFHGLPPTPRHQAAHKDGNNQNNNADNLAWVTPKENAAHARAHGTLKQGESNNLTQLCRHAVFAVRHLYQHHQWTFVQIADLMDISPMTARRIALGESRKSEVPQRAYPRPS